MDARKFLEAMNEIDEKYIVRADLFSPVKPVKRSLAARIASVAVPVAACFCIIAAFLFVRDLGLLTESPGPAGNSSAASLGLRSFTDAAHDATMQANGALAYSDPEYQTVYDLFQGNESPVLTGADAAQFAGNKHCVKTITITCPMILKSWSPQTESETGGSRKILCALYQTDYGFYGGGVTNEIKTLGGYWDLAGLVVSGWDDDSPAVLETWYPKDGALYTQSVLDFLEADGENEAEMAALWQSCELWKAEARQMTDQLLLSYMEQNGLTDYNASVSAAEPNASSAASALPVRLTIEDVKELAKKGKELTWDDLKGYEYEDAGSGVVYLYRFLVDEDFQLVVPSVSETGFFPEGVLLSKRMEEGDTVVTDPIIVDITTGNVEQFLTDLEEGKTIDVEESTHLLAKLYAQSFVAQCLSNEEHPLAECFYQNLRIIQIKDDGTGFLLSLRLVLRPEDPNDTYWWAGNTKEGTGENEGYLTAARMLLVEYTDGEWTVTPGTGGFSTEGYHTVNWSVPAEE